MSSALCSETATRLLGVLTLGDPSAELVIGYQVKERLRDFYRVVDPRQAKAMLEDLIATAQRAGVPEELKRFARTLDSLVRSDYGVSL